jgi:hypothetical protein
MFAGAQVGIFLLTTKDYLKLKNYLMKIIETNCAAFLNLLEKEKILKPFIYRGFRTLL